VVGQNTHALAVATSIWGDRAALPTLGSDTTNLGGVKALLFERRESRYAAAILTSKLSPGAGALVAPLRMADIDEPEIPGPGWKRITPLLSGICGSDLSTLTGHTSRYFEPLVSFPFVMGHEVVGMTENGNRVVIDAVLGHAARGADLPFDGAAPADGCDHGHLIGGHLEAGLQIGSCESTSGGWSTSMIAHESQLHVVPETMSDESAVMHDWPDNHCGAPCPLSCRGDHRHR
jgi:D-arabinose 1-dehydrogenase-like Zn-dependent alcohol dehydrogenase